MTKSEISSRPASAEARRSRALILAMAERHFKHYGYAKTTIVEIASDCAMSHANVYRFFRSKSDLVDAVASLWLDKIIAVGTKVVDRPGTTAERLVAFTLELHRMKKRELLNTNRIHELLSIAAQDGRSCIEVHESKIAGLYERIVQDGISSCEFACDDAAAAGVALQATTIKFCHPWLVEQYQDQDLERQIRDVLNIAIGGLRTKRKVAAP